MTRSISPWNRCVLLLLVAVVAFFQTWVDLWPFWENKNATYTHGTLIALIALWLVWRTRREVNQIIPVPNIAVLAVVLPLTAVWLLASRANVFIVHVALWPILAFAILWAGVGWRVASRLAFPLSFLYFAIPLWDYLKPPLQWITSTVVGQVTGAAGLPAAVDGPYIFLPSGTIFIALDCSGAHFLAVALAVGVLAGVTRGDSIRTRILILIVAGVLSMAFNWLRILLIILAYLHPDLKHQLETIGHFTFGWWVFALDLVAFYVALRFVPSSAAPPKSGAVPPVESLQPDQPARFAFVIAASLLLPLTCWAIPRMNAYPGVLSTTIELPGALARTSHDTRWEPRFRGAAWEHRSAFVGTDGRVIEIYGNEYHQQSQGSELISEGSPLFDPALFRTITENVIHLNGGAGVTIEANRVELVDQSKQQWLSLYAYIVDNDTIASARRTQLVTAFRSLYGRPVAGVLAVTIPCVPDCVAVEEELGNVMLRVYDVYLHDRGT